MKKIALYLPIVITSFFSPFTNSAPNWTGFYLGGNAGYWRSHNNTVTTTGSPNFINPTFEFGSSQITNALAEIATNQFSFQSYGFIGGGRGGYNYEYKKFFLGLDISLDGLTNSNNSYNLQKTVNLTDFDENYVGSLTVKQNINYLGTVRARLGYLLQPTFLLYATGGFAYGNVTFDTAWIAQESLGQDIFPTISRQNNITKTLTGWTAGLGLEWLFRPQWSSSLEYTYFCLDNLHAPVKLDQINASLSPRALWGSVAANTTRSLSVGTIRLGVNYHFS